MYIVLDIFPFQEVLANLYLALVSLMKWHIDRMESKGMCFFSVILALANNGSLNFMTSLARLNNLMNTCHRSQIFLQFLMEWCVGWYIAS